MSVRDWSPLLSVSEMYGGNAVDCPRWSGAPSPPTTYQPSAASVRTIPMPATVALMAWPLPKLCAARRRRAWSRPETIETTRQPNPATSHIVTSGRTCPLATGRTGGERARTARGHDVAGGGVGLPRRLDGLRPRPGTATSRSAELRKRPSHQRHGRRHRDRPDARGARLVRGGRARRTAPSWTVDRVAPVHRRHGEQRTPVPHAHRVSGRREGHLAAPSGRPCRLGGRGDRPVADRTTGAGRRRDGRGTDRRRETGRGSRF